MSHSNWRCPVCGHTEGKYHAEDCTWVDAEDEAVERTPRAGSESGIMGGDQPTQSVSSGLRVFGLVLGIVFGGFAGGVVGAFIGNKSCNSATTLGCENAIFGGLVWGVVAGILAGVLLVVLVIWPRGNGRPEPPS